MSSLLTVATRKAYFKELGFGAYNEANIRTFQRTYMLREKDVDGEYGTDTDNTLRTVYNVYKYTKNFKPAEFRCECGGKYCCGFPSYMKPQALKNIQTIRDHYGRPITVTCGLRDKKYNASLKGSVVNSGHLEGRAIDFYQAGVTDTLPHRKSSIKYIKGLKGHRYTYGKGINSLGQTKSWSYMGNALHTEVN